MKDILFPARCPVCHDLIPIERRVPHYRLKMRAAASPGQAVLSDWRDHPKERNTEEKPLISESELIQSYICPECLSDLSLIETPYCRKCGKQLSAAISCTPEPEKGPHGMQRFRRAARPYFGQERERLCTDCGKKERSFRQCRCLMSYDETAQEIMADIKYNAKPEYVRLLALLAAKRLGPWIRAVRPDLIVPVPIHPDRLQTRGYNQAELIADALSEILEHTALSEGIPLRIPVRTGILRRVRKTEAQKGLHAGERLLNLQNAFEVPGFLEEHPRILLIDDIYTTGATLNSCAEALLRAGASDVYGLCIAAGVDLR